MQYSTVLEYGIRTVLEYRINNIIELKQKVHFEHRINLDYNVYLRKKETQQTLQVILNIQCDASF